MSTDNPTCQFQAPQADWCTCLFQCLALWDRVSGEERWTKDWGLKATAAAQRVSISLAAFADRLYQLMQPHAEAFKVVLYTKARFTENGTSIAPTLGRKREDKRPISMKNLKPPQTLCNCCAHVKPYIENRVHHQARLWTRYPCVCLFRSLPQCIIDTESWCST